MKTITTLLALIVMASPSFAATTKKAAATNNEYSSKPTSVESTGYTQSSSNNGPVQWNASFGLGTAGDQFHFGLMANGMYNVANLEFGQFAVGGQTGFLFGPGDVTTWIIPVMASTQLTFKPAGNFVPYAGLSMGVGISHAGVDVSNTNVDFAMFVKGGATFGENQKYFAELPLGTLGNSFSIIPSFGMKF
jgi:hypothetical protein